MLFVCGSSFSQIFTNPNYALKSHETLMITRVETTTQVTVISLTVENRIEGGYFCADKNIFMIYPDGTRSKLLSSKGIPACPNSYKFKTIGEKLSFELSFPALKKGTDWIDLIEDCSDICFSFFGICLNGDLNKKIDDASLLAETGEPAKALIGFINIANTIDSRNSGIGGLIYMNIVQLSKEAGNITEAKEWYRKLESASIPRKELYIKHLNAQGIIY